MSHRASAWAKPVTHGTTGEPIKVTEKAVLLVLCDYINDECGLAWPGIRRLAREACCAKSTLKAALDRLEQKGLLVSIPRTDQGGRSLSNAYGIPPLYPRIQYPSAISGSPLSARGRPLSESDMAPTESGPSIPPESGTAPSASDSIPSDSDPTGPQSGPTGSESDPKPVIKSLKNTLGISNSNKGAPAPTSGAPEIQEWFLPIHDILRRSPHYAPTASFLAAVEQCRDAATPDEALAALVWLESDGVAKKRKGTAAFFLNWFRRRTAAPTTNGHSNSRLSEFQAMLIKTGQAGIESPTEVADMEAHLQRRSEESAKRVAEREAAGIPRPTTEEEILRRAREGITSFKRPDWMRRPE